MKKSILGAACAIALAAPAHAAVIDFDNLPGGGAIANGTVISDQYSTVGARVSVFEEGNLMSGGPLATIEFAPDSQQGNRLGNFFDNDIERRADILRIEFAGLANDISFDFFPQGELGDDTRVIAYDANGNVLSDQLTGISGFEFELFNVAANGVKRLDILQPDDAWNWGLDNLSFTLDPAAVPEPSTVVLLAGALAALGFARRRRA
jgi:PEP-CTERM motif